MTKIGFLLAGAALSFAAPASAQLIGGGLGGGLGGRLGGGFGAPMGGLGGTVNGSLHGTIERPVIDTRAADHLTRAERKAAKARARQGATVDLSGAAATPQLVGNGSIAAGKGRADADGAISATLGVRNEMMRTRGAVAASRRGLVSAAPSTRGVAVFVPQAPTTTVAAPAGRSRNYYYGGGYAYPVYDESYYYGLDPVVIQQTQVEPYMDRQQRDFERDLAGTGADVRRQGNAIIIELPADVTFAFDHDDIRPRFFGVLDRFAATLAAYPGSDVEVIGHTDALGTASYNVDLSERRGRSVADYLVGHGIDPARLVVEAMGSSEPIASNATADGRAENRRVEFVVHPRTA